MRVLIAYASAQGSTQEVAERIGARIADHDHQVSVAPVHQASPGDHDAVVVGSAMHDGRWLPEATRFVASNAGDLRARPTWFFTVSSLGRTSSFFPGPVARLLGRMRGESRAAAQFRDTVGPRGHRDFAGVIGPDQWGRIGNLVLRAFGGRFGDHRDWADIERWADGIGRELRAGDARQVD